MFMWPILHQPSCVPSPSVSPSPVFYPWWLTLCVEATSRAALSCLLPPFYTSIAYIYRACMDMWVPISLKKPSEIQICSVAEAIPELLFFLLLPSKCWFYRQVPSCLVNPQLLTFFDTVSPHTLWTLPDNSEIAYNSLKARAHIFPATVATSPGQGFPRGSDG